MRTITNVQRAPHMGLPDITEHVVVRLVLRTTTKQVQDCRQ